jgi:plastocyanin
MRIQHGFHTGLARRRLIIGTCVTLVLASLAASISATAADISVVVVSRDGHGVEQTVVVASPMPANVNLITPPKPAVMDQRDLTFQPRVLVVEVGTSVEFPNNDSVSHQVYSFSAAKRFQLPLYKGERHSPVIFDQPGLVVLGCNIHDSMVGYIYITDAPFFGTTDKTGSLSLEGLPAGDYRLTIWSPYIADTQVSLTRTVHVDGSAMTPIQVQLNRPLRAQPEPKPHRRDWEY